MATAVILILTIIVSFATIEPAQTSDPNKNDFHFKNDMLFGKWNVIAQAVEYRSSGPLLCRSVHITKGDINDINVESHVYSDGVYDVSKMTANIHGLEIQDSINQTNGKPRRHRITYCDNNLLVLDHIDSDIIFTIYSRDLTVPDNVLRPYINEARMKDLYIEYVNNQYCYNQKDEEIAKDMTIANKLSGKWYMILGICPRKLEYESTCANMNITNIQGTTFDIRTYKRHDPYKYIREWTGKIYNSKLVELHKDFLYPPVYSLTFYNNEKEIFLQSVITEISCDAVWSRDTNTPDDLLVRYKKIANSKRWILREISHKNCY